MKSNALKVLISFAAGCAVLWLIIAWWLAPTPERILIDYINTPGIKMSTYPDFVGGYTETFKYNPKYVKDIKLLLSRGNRNITKCLFDKYINTTGMRLLPDEDKDDTAPLKYRPYLVWQRDKCQPPKISKADFSSRFELIAINGHFGIATIIDPLFNKVSLLADCGKANRFLFDMSLAKLHSMRVKGVFDASKTYLLIGLLFRKSDYVPIDKRLLAVCEMLYIYSAYESWPSIRNAVWYALRVISTTTPSVNAMQLLAIVDNQGLKNALDAVSPDLCKQFQKTCNLHKKAPFPIKK